MEKVYLSLGSNIGNRKKYLSKAVNELRSVGEIKKISQIYQTVAWGVTDQNDFYNLCLLIETNLTPESLLEKINSIEKFLGRKKRGKWQEREIDIDILFYGSQSIKTPNLVIPHPEIINRAFVLVPLSEIAPNYKHPEDNKTIASLEKQISSDGVKSLGAL